MSFVGLDLGGLNSLACVRRDDGGESLVGAIAPERPSSVLLPMIRREGLIAGDDALRCERGSGLVWPPMARAAPAGWSQARPPEENGRVLLGVLWEILAAGGRWPDPEWQPDGLPPVSKPAPAECICAEASAVLRRPALTGMDDGVVIAVPNELPEESQEALLQEARRGRLPPETRLVWRSVAAAMAHSETDGGVGAPGSRLAVIDAGFYSVEVSSFDFRVQEVDGRRFLVPIRRPEHLRRVETGALLTDGPAPFLGCRPDPRRLEPHLAPIAECIKSVSDYLICGPLGRDLVTLLRTRYPQLDWKEANPESVARGAALFASRLARGWPTYLDVLPSLELFTLNASREPNWLALIPEGREVAGGLDFEQVIRRRIFIGRGTLRLGSWLQRSGERDFRKLSTLLPAPAERDAWMDLEVRARSAGGFARVRIIPSSGEFNVFGGTGGVMLDWKSMERVRREPEERWPKGTVRFGWPACGKLYAHRPLFEDFLRAGRDRLRPGCQHNQLADCSDSLPALKEVVKRTVSPRVAGVTAATGDASPVNHLVCFSTHAPCEFLLSDSRGHTSVVSAEPRQDATARQIAETLWNRLRELKGTSRVSAKEVVDITYILGRMGGYAPTDFVESLSREIRPGASGARLFAAGRVLGSPRHGRHLFEALEGMERKRKRLNNNWLRMLVYVLYQREDVLRDVEREHALTAAQLALNALHREVQQGRVATLFINSLRTLALLLRIRRYPQGHNFLCAAGVSDREALLAKQIDEMLCETLGLRLPTGGRMLATRVRDWLRFAAETDEMPPIASSEDEDEEASEQDNEE